MTWLLLHLFFLQAGVIAGSPATPQLPRDAAHLPAVHEEELAGEPSAVKRHLETGIELAKAQQLSAAAEQFVEALEVEPRCVLAHYYIGDLRMTWGDPQAAVESFRQALAINPAYLPARLDMANALTQLAIEDQAYVNQAKTAYEKVLALDPKQPEAYSNLGYLSARRQDFQSAAADYKKVLLLDSHYPHASLNLGICLYRLGNIQEASVCLKEAVSEEPKSATAHCFLGLVLNRQQKWGAASKELAEAVQLDPGNRESHYAWAEALRQIGRTQEAAAQLSTVERIQTDDESKVQTRFLNGEAARLVEAGEADEAVNTLRRSLAANATPQTLTKLGCILLWKGDTEEAIGVLEKATAASPSDEWARYDLGMAFARNRQYAEARESLQQALKLRQNFPEAELYMGLTYAGEGRFQDAEPYLVSAVHARPDVAPTHYYLGLVLKHLGSVKKAQAEIATSQLLDPCYGDGTHSAASVNCIQR